MMINEWSQTKEAIEALATRWLEILQPVYEAILQTSRAIYDSLWQAYLAAGAPYGESDEGMWRWMQECAEAARLRREAEEIEIHHQQMAAFRKMMIASERGQ